MIALDAALQQACESAASRRPRAAARAAGIHSQWKADKAAAELQLLADDPTYRPGPNGARRERALVRHLDWYCTQYGVRPTLAGVDAWSVRLAKRRAFGGFPAMHFKPRKDHTQ